ncbi:hypothetical protein PIB30_072702 [Stylosanthes scabra]|uniref:Uncharacterized protein n=1 Tax=Stylosanthes scabra TaxID=79078 RepID=A0ABU6UN02_9FABA|nr:hypothetical protein [Stylosanthes scabra]
MAEDLNLRLTLRELQAPNLALQAQHARYLELNANFELKSSLIDANDKEKKLGTENKEIEEEIEKQKKKQRMKNTRNREIRSLELPLVSIGHVWTKLQHGPNVLGPNVTLIGKKEAQHTQPRSRLSHVLA